MDVPPASRARTLGTRAGVAALPLIRQTRSMSQLLLENVPHDLLDRLDSYARQLGVSATEAAARLLSRALPPPTAPAVTKAVDGALIERDGFLLHTGQLIPGATWPDVDDVRDERIDDLIARSSEGSV